MSNIFTRTMFIISLILGSGLANAQNFGWVRGMGGTGSDNGQAVAVDKEGNAFIVGAYSVTANFNRKGNGGDTLASKGLTDVHVTKYDKDGTFLWTRSIGGDKADYGYGTAVDGTGNVYVTGTFSSATMDLNPGGSGGKLENSGGSDVYLVKYDGKGTFLWAKAVGNTGNDNGEGVAVDGMGNVVVTGSSNSPTIDFNPGGSGGTLTLTSLDAVLAKYDGNGNFLWAKGMGGSGSDNAYDVAADVAGNVYVSGRFQSAPADFNRGGTGGTISPAGSYDAYLTKYDASGKFMWAKAIGGTKSSIEAAYGVAVGLEGTVFITGQSNGDSIDFNRGGSGGKVPLNGGYDAFLAGYDASGNFLWGKGLGGSSGDYGEGVTVDSKGNVFATGRFQSATMDFNAGKSEDGMVSNAGGYDIFLSGYDAKGVFLWAKALGGAGADYGYGVATDLKDNVVATGYYASAPADFNKESGGGDTLSNEGGNDIYLVKYLAPRCIVERKLDASACKSYIFGGTTLSKSGTYSHTFTTAADCDSIVTLHLTIMDTVRSTLWDTACESYTLNGFTYSASGSYNQAFTSSAGCDSILTLNLTINRSNGTTLVVQACDSFVLNDSVYTTSDIYTQSLPNSFGCDSIITLKLVITGSPKAAITQENNTLVATRADSYQWLNCANGYAVIEGATKQSLTFNEAGSYAVIVTAGNCSDTSDCYAVELNIGISQPGGSNGIRLYPNPATKKIVIEVENPLRDAGLRVFNVTGQLLIEQKQQSGQRFEIDLESYASGFYFVEIEEGGRRLQAKVMKQ